MNIMHRLLDTSTSVLGPYRVEAIAGTNTKARDGHVVDLRGMDIAAFEQNGTILWNHDPCEPVGVPVSCRKDAAGTLRVVIDFAPAGASEKADEIRNLVKAGIVRNLSIGFHPLEMEPLEPRQPRGGLLIKRSELLEVSFVSIPSDPNAIVTARRHPGARAGKALSGANAGALREAHRLAEQCRSTIEIVLDGAGEVAEPDDDEFAQRQRQAAVLRLQIPAHTVVDQERADRRTAAAKLGAINRDMSFAARQRELAALRR